MCKTKNPLHVNLYDKRSNKFFQPSFFNTLVSLCSISIAAAVAVFKEQRPHIIINMQSILSSWLYDTGACITVMPLSLFRKIPVDQRPIKYPPLHELCTASGSPLRTIGVYYLKLTFQQRSIITPVAVCENVSQPILGIDAIKKFGLIFSPNSNSFSFENASIASVQPPRLPAPPADYAVDPHFVVASLSIIKSVKLPPLTSLSLSVQAVNSADPSSIAGVTGLAHIGHPSFPYLNGGPGIVQTDSVGEIRIRLNNCAPFEILLNKGDVIGSLETVDPNKMSQIDEQMFINSVGCATPSPLSPAERLEFLTDLKLNVPDSEKQQYLDLILNNHDVFSKNKNDLGRATNATHTIHLKNNAPIFVKQFPVPEAYREQLNLQVKEWLKMGVVKPTNSPYNSPIFVVPKKDGSPRYVLDFRKLNENSHTDKYSMKTVEECIGDIGRSGSTIFSTLDLSSGFWQLPLDEHSQKLTAFTVQNLGQFQWTRTSQGLHSAPSQYQRLMELTIKGLDNIIVYIDDLLIHNSEHSAHRKSLQLLFDRLRQANLKLNLQKCNFGSENVTYLGFRLTPQGILPGSDKLAAVKNATPPTNVHQVRQFLGLANFFRTHIRNFSLVSSPLNKLTRKDIPWRGGPLPPDALKAFLELQTALCSEPVVNYPRKDRPYALIVDAASGNDKNEGGLGAVLCQADAQGQLHVIAYASRSLTAHEKNYTPFLLEMTACTWGIDHFSVYLRGRKFTLYTDHKPLEKLSTVHTKTLNRLQQAMSEHDFVICHKPGKEMPADFLSRNVCSISSVLDNNLPLLQSQDPFIKDLIAFIKHGTPPSAPRWSHYIKQIAPSCFFENNLLWRRISRHDRPHRNVLLLPLVLADELVHDLHNDLLSGHEGISRTRERILQSYFWPNMEVKIAAHVTSCHRCQARRKTDMPKPPLLTPMPQCTSLNQRVAIDLMGPLRTSTQGKKYVLCMTDAFTKYSEIVAIPNKEAPTVGRAIFERWICRFGCPVEFTSDNGKEFCNELTKELFKLLNINHSHTTPYHPQCNSQAEVQNKVIQKYLASFVDKTTLDWPLYMAPMAFAYNTALHRSIKSTPFFLTFGIEPRLPSLPDPDIKRYYGQSDVAAWYATLHHCRQVAIQNNLNASDHMQSQFNKKAAPYNYTVGQLIWIDIRNYLGLNRKLSPNWDGPFAISKVFDNGVVECIYKNNKKIRINVARIKPFIPPVDFNRRNVNLPPVEDFNLTLPPQLPAPPQAVAVPRVIRPRHLPRQYLHPPPPPPPILAPQFHPPNPPPQQFGPIPAPAPQLPPPAPVIPPPVPAPPPPVPRLFVPQIMPPAPVPPQQQPAAGDILPDTMRVTRAVRAANHLALHPPLSEVNNRSPFTPNHAVFSGPAYVSDTFGLPVVKPGFKTPNWIKKRRKFLKNLTTAERNFTLTGDPGFPFDNVPYDVSLGFRRQQQLPPPAPAPPQPPAPIQPPQPIPLPAPAQPAPLLTAFQRFRGLLTDTTPPRGVLSPDASDSDSPPSDLAGPSPCLRPRSSSQASANLAAATSLMERASLHRPLAGYWLRSSPTAPATSQPAAAGRLTSTSSSSASSSRSLGWRQRISRQVRSALDFREDDVPIPTFPQATSFLNNVTDFFDTAENTLLNPGPAAGPSATASRASYGRAAHSVLPRAARRGPGRPRKNPR